MTEFLAKLIKPYAEFIIPAAYNLQQTLEGMGVKIEEGRPEVVPGVAAYSILTPGIPFLMVVGWVLLYAVLLLGLSLLAGYCLGRGKGAFITLAVWLIPGLLSVFNLWPHYNGVPASFELGESGAIGSPWGMVPIVLIGMLTGWCITVVLTDLLRLRDRFQRYFDHAWIAIAVLTGVFFVSDAQNRQNEQALRDTTEQVRMSSSYLLDQARWYEQNLCHDDAKTVQASCKWAKSVQPLLADYTYGEYQFFWSIGPRTDIELYAPYATNDVSDFVATVRKELDQSNQSLCGDASHRYEWLCHRVPAGLCNPDKQHFNSVLEPVAIANECIVPALVRLHDLASKQHEVVADETDSKHWRHIYYMVFSVFAGAKIANLTTRAEGVGENARMLELARKFMRVLRRLLLCLWRLFLFIGRFSYRLINAVGHFFRQWPAKARLALARKRSIGQESADGEKE